MSFHDTVLVVVAVALAALACRPPESAPRLVLLIGIDTLRADRLGLSGYPKPTSPRLDALARTGTVFERAYSTAGWTVPAVASVLSGRYPASHGAGIPGEIKNLDETPPAPIHAGFKMLAERFSNSGYATALFSANPFLFGRFRDGFETVEVARTPGDHLVDRALEWIDRPDDRPRFLYVHFMDVHAPNAAPERLRRLFAIPDGTVPSERDGEWPSSDGREYSRSDPQGMRLRGLRMAAYDAAVRWVDEQLGALQEGLAARGYAGRSLIVVFSDHGEEFWEHEDLERNWADDPRGLYGIGHGHTLFDELLQVPLILAGVGIASGERSSCEVSLVDIAPTVAAIAGLEEDPEWSGIDLRATRSGAGPCAVRPLFASSPAYGPPEAAVRIGQRKVYQRGALTPLAFDDRIDPEEVAGLNPGTHPEFERLLQILGRYLASESEMGEPQVIPDAAVLRDLQSLGYL